MSETKNQRTYASFASLLIHFWIIQKRNSLILILISSCMGVQLNFQTEPPSEPPIKRSTPVLPKGPQVPATSMGVGSSKKKSIFDDSDSDESPFGSSRTSFKSSTPINPPSQKPSNSSFKGTKPTGHKVSRFFLMELF